MGITEIVHRRNFILVCIVQFSLALAISIIEPLLPIYVASFGVSYAVVGFVMSSFGLTRVFVEIPGGILTDRFGRRPLLLAGLALSMSSHLIAGFAQSYFELIIARMIVGAGSALAMIAGVIYVSEISSPAQRQQDIARYQSMFSMGGIIGPTLGGVLSDIFGIRFIFFTAVGITCIGLIIVLRMQFSETPTLQRDAIHRSQLTAMVKNPIIMVLCTATFIMFFMYSSIRGTMIPLYGVDILQLTSTQIGLVFSFTSLVAVLGLNVLVPRLEAKISRRRLLVLSLALCVFAVTVISGASNFVTLALTAVPLGVAFSLLQPTPFTMILDTAQPENRGLMVGLLRTTGDIGIIVGPILVGSLLDIGYIVSIFYVIAGIIGIFTIISWIIFYQTKHRFTSSSRN
jgi:DHA1 family multidrug resistance protein-like MFS transporter